MTIRYGIIGTGWITEAFLAGAAGVPGMALRAVCSRSEERGREFAARHGADLVFTDPARMAASFSGVMVSGLPASTVNSRQPDRSKWVCTAFSKVFSCPASSVVGVPPPK